MRINEPFMSTLLHSEAVKKSVPISGSFELTSKCNFNCPMCYVHGCEAKSELHADEWLSVAEDAKKDGMLFLLLTGGEPLLHPDFDYIYSSLSKKGFVISINTNGSLVKNRIELFKKFPPSRVNLSLYGADAESYKSFCGGCFSDVCEGIEMLKKIGVNVVLNSVFTAKNSEYAADIVRFANQNGLHLNSTAYCYPQIRLNGKTGENTARLSPFDAASCNIAAEKLKFTPEEFERKTKKLLLSESDTSLSAHEFERVRCRAGRCSFWITSDGKMRPCGMMTVPETEPLNVGFTAAWQELRKKTDAIRLPHECAVCSYRRICPVCAAMCLSETGRFDRKPQYVCDYFNCMRSIAAAETAQDNGDGASVDKLTDGMNCCDYF